MIYQPKNPLGYQQLFTWKQAGEIIQRVKRFVTNHLTAYEDKRLTNHLIDSARSVQRNIEEGFKRATTKEYVSFLGFSRGSLEELKGDFEELKREIKEGTRGDKGLIREEKGWIRENRGQIREEKGKIREEVEELLDLIYGEDCMMGRQIRSLENKMVKEKTLPRSEMIKGSWSRAKAADERFWRLAETRFGLVRGENGKVREDKGRIRENKGKEGKDKGLEGKDKGKEKGKIRVKKGK